MGERTAGSAAFSPHLPISHTPPSRLPRIRWEFSANSAPEYESGNPFGGSADTRVSERFAACPVNLWAGSAGVPGRWLVIPSAPPWGGLRTTLEGTWGIG